MPTIQDIIGIFNPSQTIKCDRQDGLEINGNTLRFGPDINYRTELTPGALLIHLDPPIEAKIFGHIWASVPLLRYDLNTSKLYAMGSKLGINEWREIKLSFGDPE